MTTPKLSATDQLEELIWFLREALAQIDHDTW